MILPNKKQIFVFDNKGVTADRFTIVLKDSTVYTCCLNPFDANGIALRSHTQTDFYVNQGLKITPDIVIKALNELLQRYRKERTLFGEEINDFNSLPNNVQQYILNITK